MRCDPSLLRWRPAARIGRRAPRALVLVLVALLGVSAATAARAVEIPDGEWVGEWDPGSSCRDTRKREMTARTEAGHITGQVLNPPARSGVFGADIVGGRFRSALAGLKRDTFSLYGRAKPEEIKGTWSGRDDCGSGSFVLRRVMPAPTAAQPPVLPPPAGQPAAAPAAPARQAAPAQTAPVGDPAALEALENLRSRGLISEAEYAEKLALIRRAAPADAVARPSASPPAPPAVPPAKPAVLLEAPAAAPPVEAPAAQASAADRRLAILDQLMSEDLITEDEYLRKKAEIQSGAN